MSTPRWSGSGLTTRIMHMSESNSISEGAAMVTRIFDSGTRCQQTNDGLNFVTSLFIVKPESKILDEIPGRREYSEFLNNYVCFQDFTSISFHGY